MLSSSWSCRLLATAVLVVPGTTRAHFVLQSPAAMHEQSQLGDPQKAPPCGDNGNAVATNMVTAFKGGDVVKITINETIFHPGHYRIALAVNDISELPAEPPVTAGDTDCGSTIIANPPAFPVLADGVFLHDKPFDGPQSIDVTLPADVNCDNCTLQVIQFMSNHGLNNPGGCFYHHCAAIAVESGGAGSTGGDDTGGTAGTNATTVTTDPTNATNATGEVTGDPVTSTSNAEDGGSATGTGGSPTGTGDAPTTGGAATSGATATAGEASTDGANDGGDGGCGCDVGRGGAGPATLLGMVGLLGLARRRRAR